MQGGISDHKKIMKQSTTNQIKGRGRELKGAVKEKLGRATNNREMESRGTMEKTGGKIQKKAGDVVNDLRKD
jgi:uncharacterized protein YjbJ (UPF0337 family)